MDAWTIDDARKQYLVSAWGAPYVDINERGHAEVAPAGAEGGRVDLKDLVDDLLGRGLSLPILVRFNGILEHRLRALHAAFDRARQEYDYAGAYRAVLPVKVNQRRQVVEQLLRCGREHHLGLEVGSKPELMLALALVDDPEALIVCNGYKDAGTLEAALSAQRLGRRVLVVIDRFEGLEPLLRAAERLGVEPRIGLRAKLSSRGSGKWRESGGDRSKFGLTAGELLQAVAALERRGLLGRLEMLHFHLGSQLADISAVKNALRESCRVYVDLVRLGAGLRLFDVGGGLAVDYDGSRTRSLSSMNYSLQEYANDVVATVGDACRDAGLAMPTLISESGRALTAHHAVLLFDVLGVNRRGSDAVPRAPGEADHAVHHLLWEAYHTVSRKAYQEAYNDLLEYRQQIQSLYSHGVLDLPARAYAEELAWACAQRIRRVIRQLDDVPEELDALEHHVADTYYCNLSVFQSAPDHWAVRQLFPVMPIHRLERRPTRPATIADLTCDSDGRIDRFIDLRDVRDTLLLHPHPPDDDPYVLGLFLVGAYQETLGAMHNLFGAPAAVHVDVAADGLAVSELTPGQTVGAVLERMDYDRRMLVERLRKAAERALRRGAIGVDDVRRLMDRFAAELDSSTYLEP
jgi:arginine decarboxylase